MKVKDIHTTDPEWLRSRRLPLQGDADSWLLESLIEINGVHSATIDQNNVLSIEYDLSHTSLFHLQRTLAEHDCQLAGNALQKFMHSVYRYTEHVQIKNRMLDTGWDVWVRDVYLDFYRNRQHGKRDERAQQWRKYIKDS